MNIRYQKHKTVMVAFVLALMVMWGITMSASAQNQLYAPTILSSAGCTVTVNSGQSITTAVSSAGSGSVVCVRAGVYNERLKLTPSHSGITVQAYPGETPIIEGAGLSFGTTPSARFTGLVQISGSNITVEGFEVRNSPGRGVVIGNSGSAGVTKNTTVRNMIVHDSWDSGININGTETQHIREILIEGNQVYDNLKKNLTGDTGGSALTFSEADASIARGNIVYHNMGEGLVADRHTIDVVLEGNIAFDNHHANIYLLNTIRPVVQGNLVFCTDDRTYWKPVVYNNATTYKAGRGIQMRDESFNSRDEAPDPGYGHVVINNLVIGCGINFGVASQVENGGMIDALIANNTFVNAQGDIGPGTNNVLMEKTATYRNSRFVNNIIVQTLPGETLRVQSNQVGVPDLSTLTISNNLYWPVSTVSSLWAPNEPGRLSVDPKLVNPVLPTMGNIPDPANYGLLAGSPAINAGAVISQFADDFFGAARSGAFDLGAIEFTSAAAAGQIRVATQVGSGSGTPQLSFVTNIPPGSFQLNAGATYESSALEPGMYDVAMTPLANWSQSSATCDDGSNPLAIDLGSGETVTCTFTLAEQAQTGTIVVTKETIPSGTTQPFSFTASYNSGFELADGQSHTAASLAAGTYSVSETNLSGWSATSATCDDGSSPASIELSAGETVTCTFVSTQAPTTGTIIVAQETDPNGATDPFAFSTSYGAGFELADGETSVSVPLNAGTYWVAQDELDGWTAADVTCSDGSAPSAINLAAAETVTCTFTNRQEAVSETTEVIYLTPKKIGSVGGFSYGTEDILAYDTTNDRWTLYLDLSKVGLSKNLNGFAFMEDGSVLLAFARNQPVNGLGTASPRDVVRFIPSGTGSATAGTFEWYFKGASVGLTTSAEVIDSLAFAPDGRLLISTVGTAVVKTAGGANLRPRDEDLIAFDATRLGENAAGSWELYFDGSTVPGLGVEDVNGAWIDATNGDIYLTVNTGFNIGGTKGNSKHIIRLRPNSDGYDTEQYWFGPDHGFTGVPNGFGISR